jgi:hypothetical protein
MSITMSAREVAMKLEEALRYTDGGMRAAAAFAPNLMGDFSAIDQCIRAALKAATLLPEPAAVPDGWKLVPVEPSSEMLRCGDDAYFCINPTTTKLIYKTMLAAAPTPEGKT